MAKFVIRRKSDGAFLKGGRGGSYNLRWVDDIAQARTYDRKCDASNSITGHFGGYYSRWRGGSDTKPADLEVVSVSVSISQAGLPSIELSPEVLDRATRYVLVEQAREKGAPASLIAAFDDLSTGEVSQLVATLYQGK